MPTSLLEAESRPRNSQSERSNAAPAAAPGSSVNVAALERAASVLTGGALIAHGLKRGGLAGAATAVVGGVLAQRGVTGHCQVYDALGVSTHEVDGQVETVTGVDVSAVTTVGRPVAELYAFWREPVNLPRFMKSVSGVRVHDERRATWTLAPPVGPELRFDVEVTDDVEDDRIAWRSVDETVVRHRGEVRFSELPNGRGATVRLRLRLMPPGGSAGASLARLFDGALEMQLRAELKRFKQLMETGEVATIDGQPSGREG